MRVVVFHQGALGDFLFAVPVLDGLHEFRPELRIDFWSKREHVSLLEGKSYLAAFHTLEGRLLPSLLHEDLWISTPLPDFLTEADQVFIFGQAGTRILAERLSTRLQTRVDWIRSFPGTDETGVHVTDFLRRQFNRLGWKTGTRFGRLIPNADELDAVKTLLHDCEISSPPILIHPGSGGKRKIWPLKSWHELMHWITRELSIPVLLSVGPADERLESFSRTLSRAGFPIVSGLQLPRLAALLSECRLYAGSDSGITHLAAALGVQTVAVFGPTDSGVWGPRGDRVRIIQKDWREEGIFEWDSSRSPQAADGEVTCAVMELLSNL